jgi:hypothetical protein
MTLSAEWIKRHVWLPWDWKNIGRLNDKEYNQTKLILLVVVLACFLTPTGIRGALYPLTVLFQISGDSKIFFSKIIELQKTDHDRHNFFDERLVLLPAVDYHFIFVICF